MGRFSHNRTKNILNMYVYMKLGHGLIIVTDAVKNNRSQMKLFLYNLLPFLFSLGT